MKRALVISLILLVGGAMAGAVAFYGTNAVWKRAGRQEWPAGLGTLEGVETRYPKREPSVDALRLADLARPLGIEFADRKAPAPAIDEALAKFVERDTARSVAAIEAPPVALDEFVAEHAAELDAVRDHLIGSSDIVWQVDLGKGLNAPVPNLLAHLRTARLLIARALIRARSGDPRAWADLRAASMIDRSLQSRPDFTSQLIALVLARRITAASWKLPAPAPAWLADYHAIDRRRLFLLGVQIDSWVIWRHAPVDFSNVLQRVYVHAAVANLALHQHRTATEMFRVTDCGFDAKAYSEKRAALIPKWNVVAQIAMVNYPWSRVLRYEAEREAAANALRVRAGQPLAERSQCTDGSWRFEKGRMSFTPAIPREKDGDMPLSLSL